jgi:hypothetical protein
MSINPADTSASELMRIRAFFMILLRFTSRVDIRRCRRDRFAGKGRSSPQIINSKFKYSSIQVTASNSKTSSSSSSSSCNLSISVRVRVFR